VVVVGQDNVEAGTVAADRDATRDNVAVLADAVPVEYNRENLAATVDDGRAPRRSEQYS